MALRQCVALMMRIIFIKLSVLGIADPDRTIPMQPSRTKPGFLAACALVAGLALSSARVPSAIASPADDVPLGNMPAHVADDSVDHPLEPRSSDEVTDAHKRRRVGDTSVAAAPLPAVDRQDLPTPAAILAATAAAAPSCIPVQQPQRDTGERTVARVDLRACRGRAPPAA